MNNMNLELNAKFTRECPTLSALKLKANDVLPWNDITDEDVIGTVWYYYSNADDVAISLVAQSGPDTLAEACEQVDRDIRRRLACVFGGEYLRFRDADRARETGPMT